MAKYRSIKSFDHDPKLAEALGNMVAAWAFAESVLFSVFARTAGIGLNMAMESNARIPTFESRVKFLLALLGEWKTTEFDRDKIVTAVEKLAKLASTRNHWVHGDWCKDEQNLTVVFDHRAHPDSPKRRKPVKANDVLQHCEAVNARSAKLAELIDWDKLEG